MKIVKICIVLFAVFLVSCEKTKKDSATETNAQTELKNEKTVYRDITKLEAYKGFTMVSGEVLKNSDKALTYLKKDNQHVLVLEQIIKTDLPKANFSILKEVVFVYKGSTTEVVLTSCEFIESSTNELVFSFIKNEDTESYASIFKSWIINLEKNTFVEINPERIKCYNEHYGYDG